MRARRLRAAGRRWSPWPALVSAAFALVCGLAVSSAATSCESRPTPDIGATLERIDEHAEDYLGERVTVAGEIETILDDERFVIRDENADAELLVVMPPEAVAKGPVPRPGDIVRVTGRVSLIAGRELGLDIDFAGERHPAIIAETVELTLLGS